MQHIIFQRRKLKNNLLTNGTFDTAVTGWSAVSTPATFESSSGRAHIVGNSAGDGMSQSVTCSIGNLWELRFEYQVVTGTLNVTKTGMTSLTALTGAGLKVHRFTESDGTSQLLSFVIPDAAGEFYVDNITLRKVL